MYKCSLFLFGFSLLISCKDSKNEILEKGLIGKWSVVQSELNNKPSQTMENAFFSFEESKKVVSNVFEEEELKYDLDGQKIIIQTQIPFEMDISYFEKDSLIMEGNYSLYYLKFFMKRDTLPEMNPESDFIVE